MQTTPSFGARTSYRSPRGAYRERVSRVLRHRRRAGGVLAMSVRCECCAALELRGITAVACSLQVQTWSKGAVQTAWALVELLCANMRAAGTAEAMAVLRSRFVERQRVESSLRVTLALEATAASQALRRATPTIAASAQAALAKATPLALLTLPAQPTLAWISVCRRTQSRIERERCAAQIHHLRLASNCDLSRPQALTGGLREGKRKRCSHGRASRRLCPNRAQARARSLAPTCNSPSRYVRTAAVRARRAW